MAGITITGTMSTIAWETMAAPTATHGEENAMFAAESTAVTATVDPPVHELISREIILPPRIYAVRITITGMVPSIAWELLTTTPATLGACQTAGEGNATFAAIYTTVIATVDPSLLPREAMEIFAAMASSFRRLSCLLIFVGFLSVLRPCACYNRMNSSDTDLATSPAIATWYGAPGGAGSTGGACGYGDAVVGAPYSSRIAAGGTSLWKSGRGCGACYQVSCTANAACSGSPVTVVITDQCPGGPCASDPVHFDLSGAAFGALAKPGQADALRNAGSIHIQYARVPCSYPGFRITFKVDSGSNPNFFAVLIEFVDGDGEISAVDLQHGGSWTPMQPSFGAVWKLNSGTPLPGPFSIRLTSGVSRKTVVATNVIPVGWRPGATYTSNVNF
ncbi:hypothetical protein MUK42_33226 [Musa troglodytarum]|uniref:Uncharacterized protein n=1 Tax=Musa troglodytarum TaxID=320322 RepID=A0A9E7F9H2_9LILI|nr:hypothetical protein MUK42_33226 [Musa troglodytarum]